MSSLYKIIGVALVAALLVLAALTFYLSRDLPAGEISNFEIPAAGLNFAFGSGRLEDQVVQVSGFSDGYALLTSGPVNLQAEQLQILDYTWQPSGQADEFVFFWRQQGNASEVKRKEITATGNALLKLESVPGWKGNIIEVGFLVAGEATQPVAIGQLVLQPSDLLTRFKLVWQDWTTYELRSQQSINFLQGGDHNQIAPLPLLVILWLIVTLVLLHFLTKKMGLEQARPIIFPLSLVLFLLGWMLLDARWTINSFDSARELLRSEPDQRSGNDLDGEIYQYVQRIKKDILESADNKGGNRILVIGDENAVDYYLLRAKYHLLPDSAHVAGRFQKKLSPDSLDYVIYFGQPEAITNIPGWNGTWRKALKEVDRNEWGMVYRVRP